MGGNEDTNLGALWDGGVVTDIGPLPGESSSGAFDINNSGQVIGLSRAPGEEWEAFIWDNGVLTDLDVPRCERPWKYQ